MRAIFGYYKGIRTMPNNPGRYMELPHWLDLVSDVRLLDPAPGAPETKGLFIHGRMLVADELLVIPSGFLMLKLDVESPNF